MNVAELRVNNIVNRKFLNPSPTGLQTCFTDCKIKAIGIEKVIYECKDKSLTKVDFDRIFPIQLSEQLLLRLGAIKLDIKDYLSYNLKGIEINFINGMWIEYVSRIEITGLHHLQNIFYFRMNEELKYDN